MTDKMTVRFPFIYRAEMGEVRQKPPVRLRKTYTAFDENDIAYKVIYESELCNIIYMQCCRKILNSGARNKLENVVSASAIVRKEY